MAMINSMTGYGYAEGHLDDIIYVVEIKTVNNRYFKERIKLPESMAFLEEDIDRLLRKSLLRGTINYTLWFKNAAANKLFDIDQTALREYVEKLGHIASAADVKCQIDISSMLNLPGVWMTKLADEKQTAQIKTKVLDTTQQAIDRLKQMRAAEGAALVADLANYCRAIKNDLDQIRTRSSIVLEEYAAKLKKRVDELLAEAKLELDEATLAREVAVFAERSDISEETTRLESHLQRFAESCQATSAGNNKNADSHTNEQTGRRLDFISQEMLREANTIASKAGDTEIVNWVVNIKCNIERIKEQVQNIE
jgi:uncharacterized protein (TIGR00255 family)